jgi:dihydropteroate synthase-like protein
VPHILFVTGKLAAPALRRVVDPLTQSKSITAEIAVLPISVAALLTTDWVARHVTIPEGVDRVILPGLCRGDLESLKSRTTATVERGPADLRELPEFLGSPSGRRVDYGSYDIQILAEINHAATIPLPELVAEARRLVEDGADIIDLGCDPGGGWHGVGDAVAALRREALQVSVDSFDPLEVESALAAGAQWVLSVNSCNRVRAKRWHETYGATVVAIPDTPDDDASLDQTAEQLDRDGVPFWIDPILEPIGFGFAASLGRYLDARRRHPGAEVLMGTGNLTELTDVDSAGLNVMLLGFCQEIGIHRVLTTQVINWCRSSVRELDLARRLVAHAVRERVPPKRLEPNLVMLRDPKVPPMGEADLQELASLVTDRNYRLFAEGGELHVINGRMHLRGTDPFELFAELARRDATIDASHAFYLGYELSKAVTALTLGKAYTQDQALRWGFLTIPERSHRNG